MSSAPKHWTTRELLRWTTDYFESKQIDSARLAAEMLLAYVLDVQRLRLYMESDRPTTDDERSRFRALVERAARHEPVDYLVGWTPFFTMQLAVTPDVLIPRPSTETLVEHIIQHARSTEGFANPRIAEIGVGSGAVSIALAKHTPGSTIVATDISEAALAVAKQNAEAQGVADRTDFRYGDLLEPLGDETFHYLVSNPPYISDAEWADVAPNVKEYEPVLALRGGADGLDLLRPLIAGARRHLQQPGQLLLEIAASQEQAILELAAAAGFADCRVLKDHERLPRVLVAEVG